MRADPGGCWRARAWPWLLAAALLAAAPWVVRGSLALGLLAQMGVAVIACLSYNILLGHSGLLSFGHAVYTGLGAYGVMHLLAAAARQGWPLPVSLLPLAGGVVGLALALALGWLGTRRGGVVFAMTSLGLGELVFALALMWTDVFGGESGIAADRVLGAPVLGISFGPVAQVYGLVAVYTLACVALMRALTGTPLGRLFNAARDNAERLAFIGFDAQRVRWLAVCMAGFFAGIAGGLSALLFEIVTPEALGAQRSGAYLLFTFVGGATVFYGPVMGGVLLVLASVWLSALTPAWLLYLGLVFVLTVMFAPQGLAGACQAGLGLAAQGRWRVLWRAALALLVAGALALAGLVAGVEMLYRLLHADGGPDAVLRLWGLALDSRRVGPWLAALACALAGGWAARRAHGRWRRARALAEAMRAEGAA